MLILGLLLVVVSAAAVASLVAYNSSGGPEQLIVLFGRDVLSVTPLQAFLAGIVVAVVFCLGVWMIVTTERRRRVVRSEFRAARREAKIAAKERDELAKQLEHERAATVEPERPTGWTPPEQVAAAPPAAAQDDEPRRSFGRHFRRQNRTDDAPADQPASTSLPPR